MLQGIETQIGEMGSLRVAEDPEDPAFFTGTAAGVRSSEFAVRSPE
jgi:hypothetical protein